MSQQNPTDVEATTYAESYILYGDQTRAFRSTFPDAKCNQKVANEKASGLHKTTKVVERIKDLRVIAKRMAEDEFKISAADLQKTLALVIKKGLGDKTDAQQNTVAQNLPAVVSAVGEVNRMNGNHAPTKLGIGGDPGNPIRITTLTSEEADNLLNAIDEK